MWNFILVRERLEAEGRTTRWLAQKVGLDIKSLGNVLRGRKPSLPVIKLISISLDIPEEDLLKPPKSAS